MSKMTFPFTPNTFRLIGRINRGISFKEACSNKHQLS